MSKENNALNKILKDDGLEEILEDIKMSDYDFIIKYGRTKSYKDIPDN